MADNEGSDPDGYQLPSLPASTQRRQELPIAGVAANVSIAGIMSTLRIRIAGESARRMEKTTGTAGNACQSKSALSEEVPRPRSWGPILNFCSAGRHMSCQCERDSLRYFEICAGLALVVLGLVTFWPVVHFDFLNWDDFAYIHDNPSIHGWTLKNLYGVATETVTRNYAPLTILSLLMDHTLTGMNPAGYHLTNVVLHVINGLLVFVLVQRLSGSRYVGWATAALFLVHPVQIETVAWISSRKGLLSGTLMLWALVVRLRPDAQPKHDGWYIGLLIASLLSKALAIMLPPIVLSYDLLVRREKFSEALVRQFIPGLLSLLLLFYTMGAQNSIMGGVRHHMDLPLWQILAVDVTILWRYLGMLAWPTDLCVLYDPPTSGIAGQVITGLAGWVAVIGVFWNRRQQQPLWLFSLATFFLLLFPVLNFFRITTLMNDRYLYLPCICVFGLAAAAVQRLAERVAEQLPGRGRGLSGLAAGAVLLLAVCGSFFRTQAYLPVWKNPESLWSHAMQHVPQLAVVRIQWASTLHASGRVREAVDVLRLAQQECHADDADRRRMEQHLTEWTAELPRIAAAP
jgi:hypothetical protein